MPDRPTGFKLRPTGFKLRPTGFKLLKQSMLDMLSFLYPRQARDVAPRLRSILSEFAAAHPAPPPRDPIFTERDVILICYADHVHAEGEMTLQTMRRFLREYVLDSIPTIHFLPFFPYSSDDGFSVTDYYRINPEFGNWDDISAISNDFELMFDLVINHASAQSEWFRQFLAGHPDYRDYFIAFEEPPDVSGVFRPRTHPLLTRFETAQGTRHVWTTFSEDQIDVNFSNPEVLLEFIRILLFYVLHGATVIRLDAIAFLWKELGTSSLHLAQTHMVVKLMREVLEEVAPNVLIITETNVPHADNVSYFGSGDDEAHMVYNFALPPLLLYSLMKGDATELTRWAQMLEPPSPRTTFFNFTASHDGIGVTALRAMLPGHLTSVLEWVEDHGGRVNYRSVPDQNPVPYELNIGYLNAVGGVEPFLVSQAIALALQGVPAIYFNSLIGAKNWQEGVETLGYNRAINREKFDFGELSHDLGDAGSTRHIVYETYTRMLRARRNEPLFSPLADQRVLDLDPRIFAVVRSQGDTRLLAMTNVSAEDVHLDGDTLRSVLGTSEARDLLSGERTAIPDDIRMSPYSTIWMR